jgi:hypothetical protein
VFGVDRQVSTADERRLQVRPGLLATLAIAGTLVCSGCGSVTDSSVIRDWANALTAGHLNEAASYFALPAIIANGAPPVRITSRAQVREFNRLLPCGARLVGTARHGDYTYASFRLTNRVGGDCGAGAGALAATAFLIRGGRIVEWRRLPNPDTSPQGPAV